MNIFILSLLRLAAMEAFYDFLERHIRSAFESRKDRIGSILETIERRYADSSKEY